MVAMCGEMFHHPGTASGSVTSGGTCDFTKKFYVDWITKLF